MAGSGIRAIAATIVGIAGAIAGLVVALIVIFNLHTIAGLEEGYGSTPAQVVDHSVLLAVADVALLAGGALGGVLAAGWFRRSWRWRGDGG